MANRILLTAGPVGLDAGTVVSDASPLPVSGGAATLSAASTLQNAAVAQAVGSNLSCAGYNTVLFTVSGTVTSSVVTFQGLDAAGVATSLNTTKAGSNTISATTSSTGTYRASCAGFTNVRANITGYQAGDSIIVTAQASPGDDPNKVVNANIVSSTNTQAVAGDVASAATDSGNPVKIGGYASSTAPAAVTSGQRANAWLSLKGMQITSALSTTAAADARPNTNVLDSLAFSDAVGVPTCAPMLFGGGTSWDRQRANVDATALASAARTGTVASSDLVNYNGRGVRLVLSVTVASGTGGLQVQIQGKDSISSSYYQLNSTPTAVIATGVYVYDLYPTSLDTAANGITQKTQTFLPRTWRVNVAVGDASSYTYSISAVNLL